jgi:hypothetical protein
VVLKKDKHEKISKSRCIESGLSIEECQNLVGSDSNKSTVYDRCVAAGMSKQQCREATGFDNGIDDTSPSLIDDGTILGRCQQAGYASVEACREGFSGESDARISVCTALGYNSQDSCQSAFPEADIDKVLSCVSRGFATKAECDAADSGEEDEVVEEDENSSPLPAQCIANGLNKKQCKKLNQYQQCRDNGYSHGQCINYIQNN